MKVGPWADGISALVLKKGCQRARAPSLCTQEIPYKAQQEGSPMCKPGRNSSPESHRADTLILDIRSPELCENTFLPFKPPGLWCVVMAA